MFRKPFRWLGYLPGSFVISDEGKNLEWIEDPGRKDFVLVGFGMALKIFLGLFRQRPAAIYFPPVYGTPPDESYRGIPVVDELSGYRGLEYLNLVIHSEDFPETRVEIGEQIEKEYGLIPCEPFIAERMSLDVEVGRGTCLMPSVHVGGDTRIGEHVFSFTNVTVGHDVVISDHVYIAPNANILGNVTVGRGSYIGASSILNMNISLGDNVLVGMGSVVRRNIPDGSVVAGNPGRIIRKQIQ